MFSTLPKTNFNFLVKFNLSSANAFNFDWSKNLLFGKGLKDKIFLGSVENIVGKGENAGYQHFSLSLNGILSIPKCYVSKGYFYRDCVVKG